MNHLSRFAGILYPDVLQVEDLVDRMLEIMKPGLTKIRNVHTHKNFQLGTIGSLLAFNEKKNKFLALDGDLTNVRELSHELKEHGKDVSHTEPASVLLACYEIWEERFIEKIEGAFALALFDSAKETIILARDRIGQKPLYWYLDNHHFVFGSELKSLLATGLIPQTPAEDAIAMYLYFGFIPQDMSPIQNVSKLLPGNYFVYHLKKGLAIKPYWSYSSFFEKKQGGTGDMIAQNISKLLAASTRRMLPDDEPMVGCFISGGLGSATVAHEMAKLDRGHVKGFTVGFQGQNEEDMETAKAVAHTLKIPYLCGKVTADSMADELVDIVWSLDEPMGDPNIVATWNLCKLASKETRKVLSGMGSDEFLAGHTRYSVVEQDPGHMNRLLLIPPPVLKNVIIPLLQMIYKPAAYNILKISRTNPFQFEYIRHNAMFDEEKLKEASPKLGRIFDPDTFIHKFHNISRIKSTVSTLLYFDVKTRLPDLYIQQYEKLSKAHGLVWNSPFLDRSLIEYAAGLPEPEALQESETMSYLKPLTRNVYEDKILERTKKTRKDFLNSWIDKPEINRLFQLLLTGTLVETGVISGTWLKEQLENTNQERENFSVLWSLLVLEVWFHLFINRPVQNKPITTNVAELLNET